MKNRHRGSYFEAGLTAFLVIAAGLSLFFIIFHFDGILAIFSKVNAILRPVFTGVVFAFLLLPVHRKLVEWLQDGLPQYEKNKKLRDHAIGTLAILLSWVFALLVVYILFYMLVPQVVYSLVGLVRAIPGYIERIQTYLMEFLDNNPQVQAVVAEYYEATANAIQTGLSKMGIPNLESTEEIFYWLENTVFPKIGGVMTNVYGWTLSIVSFVLDIFVGVIVSIYILARKRLFAAQAKKITFSLFPEKTATLLIEETREAYRIMSGFINGKLIDSLIIGLICFVFCWAVKMPYYALIAAVIGITNIIPYFGPFIGGIPCAFLILLTDPLKGLYFIVFILLLQQFDGNILGPKILGESTGLSSFWVLFSILLFGGLFGVGGMVLGVPVFAMIYRLIRRYVTYRLRRKNLPLETMYYFDDNWENPPSDDSEEE